MLSLFHRKFNKFNNTGKVLLNYIDSLALNHVEFGVKMLRRCHCACNVVINIITKRY